MLFIITWVENSNNNFEDILEHEASQKCLGCGQLYRITAISYLILQYHTAAPVPGMFCSWSRFGTEWRLYMLLCPYHSLHVLEWILIFLALVPKMMNETMDYLETRQVSVIVLYPSLHCFIVLQNLHPSWKKQNPSFSYEVIIVNDGSPDRTTEVSPFLCSPSLSHLPSISLMIMALLSFIRKQWNLWLGLAVKK